MSAPAAAPKPCIRVQQDDFDLAVETSRLTANRTDIGAVVAFSGLCRDEGGALSALELEHYPGMAEAEITRLAQQAVTRWPLQGLSIIHRYGTIKPGQNIVLVVAASAHRHAAFEAASFLMDFLKTCAPFWKREHGVDGGTHSWVAAKTEDDDAQSRWSEG